MWTYEEKGDTLETLLARLKDVPVKRRQQFNADLNKQRRLAIANQDVFAPNRKKVTVGAIMQSQETK